jgi:DNA-directed RNA polymerase specialized sigma24 family protein
MCPTRRCCLSTISELRSRASYTAEEVKALIEHYEWLRELSDTDGRGLGWLALLTDLDAALERIPEKYWGVVLLHGLIGFSQAETAQLLRVSQQAISKRYRHGLDETLFIINGGID